MNFNKTIVFRLHFFLSAPNNKYIGWKKNHLIRLEKRSFMYIMRYWRKNQWNVVTLEPAGFLPVLRDSFWNKKKSIGQIFAGTGVPMHERMIFLWIWNFIGPQLRQIQIVERFFPVVSLDAAIRTWNAILPEILIFD